MPSKSRLQNQELKNKRLKIDAQVKTSSSSIGHGSDSLKAQFEENTSLKSNFKTKENASYKEIRNRKF